MDKTKPTRRKTESAQTTIIQWPQIRTAADYHDFDAWLDSLTISQEYAVQSMGAGNTALHRLDDLVAAKLVLAESEIFKARGNENDICCLL